MKKKVIVIGGGIAGLTAGVYALRCGFDATILESHSIAGGNCTSWKRGGYLFEGGMHWLTGSGENEPINALWRTIGALDDTVTIHTPEPFIEYDHKGTPVRFYRNVDTTEKHLIETAPDDEKEIKKLCGSIRRVKGISMPVTDIRGVRVTKKNRLPISSLFAALSALRTMKKFSGMSKKEFVGKFTNEGIRGLLSASISETAGGGFLLLTLGSLANGDGGFPEGGSLPFVERIVRRFTDMGGELLCGTRADKIITENGKAAGVMTKGNTMKADAVIVTADTMAIDRLFDTPPSSRWLDTMRTVTEPTMVTFVSLGIDADLRRYHKNRIIKLEHPISLASHTYEYMTVNNYASDPAYSPEGKAAVTVQLDGDTYDFWKDAASNGSYAGEKKRIADAVIAELTANMLEINGKVQVTDVATPLTYERYCGNWKGSWMTEMTPKMKLRTYPAAIKGLNNVYFAGQRMMPPGGLPAALMSGRTAVQYLCRDTDTVFISE